MPDPDPWDFSEYAEPDPRQSRPRPGETAGPVDRLGTSGPSSPADLGSRAPASDPFNSGTGSALTAADWTSGPGLGGNTSIVIARPPLPFLGAAAAISVFALLLAAVLGETPGVAIAAWVLAGPIAIGVLAYFIKADTPERARPIYAAPGWLRPGYVAVLVLCGLAVLVAALRIAFWVGRL